MSNYLTQITRVLNLPAKSSIFRALVDPLIDFVYPPTCISCHELLVNGSERVCQRCWDSIERVSRTHPLFIETREKLVSAGCVSDLVSEFVFEKEGAFQHIAHALKYDGCQSVGKELGRRLGETLTAWEIRADVLIPIPLHVVKLRERGYNQAALIVQGASSVTGIPVRTQIVRRRKHTQTQTQLGLDERRQNMENAFEIMERYSKEIHKKVCILIDDVITTGATINACAEELIRAGASNVIAASAALAQ